MLIKNLFRILFDYKFSLVTLVFFEFLYFVKGYKGNRFDFSNNKWMSDNIPCPYYFLFKMKKTLKRENFLNFIDLGCGSGRVINFFNKNFPNKKFIGIEYFAAQYNYCKKIFKNQSNVEIIQADFAKSDFYKYKADCYFFNDPFTNSVDFIKFMYPGILSMTVVMSSMFSGMSIVWDREFGFLKEILVAPISRTGIVIGKALGGSATAMAQGIILLILAPFLGISLTFWLVIKYLLFFFTIFRAKTVPKIDPKITQKSISAPQGLPGAILEPFWIDFRAIFDHLGIMLETFWIKCSTKTQTRTTNGTANTNKRGTMNDKRERTTNAEGRRETNEGLR